MKGFALCLVLKVRVVGIQKWSSGNNSYAKLCRG